MSATTQLASVNSALDALTAELADMAAHPKPFYTLPPGPTGQGQTISAVEYRKFLADQIDQLIAIRQKLEEPWLVRRRLGHGRRL